MTRIFHPLILVAQRPGSRAAATQTSRCEVALRVSTKGHQMNATDTLNTFVVNTANRFSKSWQQASAELIFFSVSKASKDTKYKGLAQHRWCIGRISTTACFLGFYVSSVQLGGGGHEGKLRFTWCQGRDLGGAGVSFWKSLPFQFNSNTFISFCPKRICLQGVSSSCILPVYNESLLKNQSRHRLSMLGKGLMWRLWNFDRGVWAS